MHKNLLIRCLSGLVFIAVMIGGILIHPSLYALLMLLITGIMTMEYFRMAIGNRLLFAQCTAIATGWLLFLLFYAVMRHQVGSVWFLLLVVPVTLIWIGFLYQKREEDYALSAHLFIPLIYITLPFSLTNFLVFDASGCFSGTTLLSLFVVLWASDVGAYAIGMSFGQKNGHKLFPRISPKKSWEGYIGGALTALLAGFVVYRLHWLPFPLVHCFVLALLLHVFGVWGDLAESQLKRHYHLKDSGKIMPGHGGLLDRFDSALLAFPVAIAYMKLLILIQTGS